MSAKCLPVAVSCAGAGGDIANSRSTGSSSTSAPQLLGISKRYPIKRFYTHRRILAILYHFNQLDSHTSQAPVFCLKLVLVTGHQDQCLEGPTCDKAHKREFAPKTGHLATFLASFAHVGTYYHLPNTFPSQIIHFRLASV